MKQKDWFSLHHWAGFHLSLLLSFILLTGTFATISTDMDWLANPSIRAEKHLTQKQNLDWPALLNSVNKSVPKAQILSIHRPPMPWHNIEVIARDSQGDRFRIYLDAYTHKITGQGRWLNWQRLFRQVHRHLMLETQLGITIVGLFGLVMFFIFITSLYTYRHWWRYFFSFKRIKWPSNSSQIKVKSKAAGKKRKFWSELHKIVGLWSMWFLLVISITGVWYLIERWGGAARYDEIVKTTVAHQSERHAQPSPLALSNTIQYMRNNYPKYVINQIRFITKKNIIEIAGQEHAILVRDRANNKIFDAFSGAYLGGIKGEDLNWHFRISEAADPLHFGTFSSWVYRYVWFGFGLALSLLSLTGVYMYLLRLRQTSALITLDNISGLRILWTKSHWVKWPSMALILACSYLIICDFLIPIIN
ncbi:PepSY-associated TM helix domain-containing protein [Colwellia sp. RE-S-Sl-9]